MLGLLLEILLHQGKDEGATRLFRLLLGTGFLGAFTTYSSLVVGSVQLALRQLLEALLYMFLSICLGVVAAALGIRIAQRRPQ